MIDLPELDAYLADLPTHNFPTEKPANEPYVLDIVEGWWGRGTVTDVAETQGACRIVLDNKRTFWVDNSEIRRNLTDEKVGR